MQFTHGHEFAASLDRVVAMFADPEFVAKRSVVPGVEGNESWVDGTPEDGFTVSIRRVVPSETIPSEFRSFVGRELHVRYSEVWEPATAEDMVGTFAVEIVGAPGHAAGALGLTAHGEQTEFLATGEVKVAIPLFGGMVERAVADAVIKGLAQELAAADAWLAM